MTRSADLPPPPDEYFLEIESHFAARRGTPAIFSARDWALVREWKESGVPLSIVIEAIDRCFDQRAETPRRRTISSLAYCRHAVNELWDERRDLQVGADATVPELSAGESLESLAGELRDRAAAMEDETLRVRIERAADEVARLDEKSVPEIENALIAIEEKLYEDLTELVSGKVRESIDEKLSRSLLDVRFRDAETRSRTLEANRRRILRTEIGLPRLSLFG